VRTSLKARTKGHRQTLRVQRGGEIPLRSIPAYQRSNSTKEDREKRNVTWNKIAAANYSWILEAWTQDNRSNYVKFIEEQDSLFALAGQAVYSDLGLGDAPTQDEIIATFNKLEQGSIITNYLDYFFDIATMISLTDTKPGINTKLQTIETENEFLDLLLKIKRVQNIFINFLAGVFIMQKFNKSVLDIIKSADKNTQRYGDLTPQETLCIIRAGCYKADAEMNALSETGKLLRDGFYVAQDMKEFKTMVSPEATTESFWYYFVKACISDNKTTPLSGVGGNFNVTTAAALAGRIFTIYTETEDVAKLKEAVFTSFLTISDSRTTDKTNDPETPQKIYIIKSEKRSDQKSLSVFLNKMTPEYIQFALHLIATIKRLEPDLKSKVESEAATAAPPPS